MQVQLIMWLGAWLLFVVAQSFFISGIFIAAYGETEKRPDGKDKDSPMILYPLYKYLTHSTDVPVIYSDEQLFKLLVKLEREYRHIWPSKHTIVGGYIVQFHSDSDYEMAIGVAKKLEAEKIKFIYSDSRKEITFAKDYPSFRFNKWIRMPIVGCYKCMPSYWSLLTYWLPMILVFGFHSWEILLWIANVPSVTLFNSILHKKYQ